jgi:hypothetical protein
MPPPAPCRTRKAIRDPIDQDRPASNDPTVNMVSDASHSCFVPNRSLSHPVSGITAANASM